MLGKATICSKCWNIQWHFNNLFDFLVALDNYRANQQFIVNGNGQISPIGQVQYTPMSLMGLPQTNGTSFMPSINKLNGNVEDKSGEWFKQNIFLLFISYLTNLVLPFTRYRLPNVLSKHYRCPTAHINNEKQFERYADTGEWHQRILKTFTMYRKKLFLSFVSLARCDVLLMF